MCLFVFGLILILISVYIYRDREKKALISNAPSLTTNTTSLATKIETDGETVEPPNRISLTNREGDLNIRSCASYTCSIVTTLERGGIFIYHQREPGYIYYSTYKSHRNTYTKWVYVEIPAGLNCINKPDNTHCHAGVTSKSWGWANLRYISKY